MISMMMMMMTVLLHDAFCALLVVQAAEGTHTCNAVRAGAHLIELEWTSCGSKTKRQAARSLDVMMSPSAAAASEPAGIHH